MLMLQVVYVDNQAKGKRKVQTSDGMGVTRWDGKVTIKDNDGTLIVLEAQCDVFPLHRGARLVAFSAEGLKGSFLTRSMRWCKALHNELSIEIEGQYRRDGLDGEADVHNICLLLDSKCVQRNDDGTCGALLGNTYCE